MIELIQEITECEDGAFYVVGIDFWSHVVCEIPNMEKDES